MSVASEISRISTAKANIKSAIEAKGITVPSATKIDGYASIISGMSALPEWLKDGDTHLWINISDNDQKDQQLRLRMIGTIDWGDGTTESISVTSYTTKSHTYAAIGKYRIDLKPTSGTFYLGGGANGYSIMGTRSGRYNIVNSLYQAEIGTKQITGIGTYAFYWCVGLQRIYISNTITSIGTYAFDYCMSLLKIESDKTITITGTNLTYQFGYCYNLLDVSNIKFKNATSTAGTYYCCQCLREITIYGSVTSIGASTFYHPYSLKKLWMLPTTPPTVANANAFTSLPSSCVIEVPFGSLSAYQAEDIWSTYSEQMVEGGTITYNISNVSSSNEADMVDANESYTTTLTADEGYTLGTVTVTMGGTDITSTAYSNGVVTIASVTGNITITASATANE